MEPDDDDPDGGMPFSVAGYVIYYNIGTIVLGLAEPDERLLIAPAVGIAGVVRFAEMTERVPSSVLRAISLLLPIVVAVATIVVSGNDWWAW